MAWLTTQALGFIRPANCGGLMRPAGARGTGTISGVAKLSGTPAICRVTLHDCDGTLMGFRRTGTDGAFSFIGLPPGEYRLVIEDDRQTAKRAKVEHVVISP